ncbi:DNA-binding transcriptional ArsR family regulator [Sphingomonas vulcanisoli]|uniref:DNA-binding transcriptional ArsR family regulator n=1 Tax=Sphingomonas vulcanisoli TaxID=1658060 RepID=A0ABX0TR89_9SPHN|nr:MarR family transcriptional regulator [Sphingomonas vulcanisoli]NIJ08041.1 DNA-binding transcriptional ArsR family regulator [Sphingomonas vulcanisoli]
MSEELIAVSNGTDDVIRLTDELRRIASRIRDSVPSRRRERLSVDTIDQPDHLTLAEAMLSARRRIGNHFPPLLFADPARDLLLDLYASGLRGKPVSISSACIAAAVPATTALRWIKKLQRDGLVKLERDTADNRRVLIRLSEPAVSRVEAYVNEVAMLFDSCTS